MKFVCSVAAALVFAASVEAELTLTCPTACDMPCFAVEGHLATYVSQDVQVFMDRRFAKVQGECNNRRKLVGLRGSASEEHDKENFQEQHPHRKLPVMGCLGHVYLCQFGFRRLGEGEQGPELAGLAEGEEGPDYPTADEIEEAKKVENTHLEEKPLRSLASGGFCSWWDCSTGPQDNWWCNDSENNCMNGCGGVEWCHDESFVNGGPKVVSGSATKSLIDFLSEENVVMTSSEQSCMDGVQCTLDWNMQCY